MYVLLWAFNRRASEGLAALLAGKRHLSFASDSYEVTPSSNPKVTILLRGVG